MLRHFHAVKTADFATALLASAGFDLEALRGAGDPDALKTAIEQRVAAAVTESSAKVGADAKQIGELQATLEKALAEGTRLADESAAVKAALASAGVKLAADKPVADAVAEGLKARISGRAQELLAATGTAPLVDTPTADATRPDSAKQETLTHAEFSQLTPGAKMRFCKNGGKITDIPVASSN